MSSRAREALRRTGAAPVEQVEQPPKRRRVGVGRTEGAGPDLGGTSTGPATIAPTGDRGRERVALPGQLEDLLKAYELVCFIFKINSKRGIRRPWTELQLAAEKLGRKIELDELLQIKAICAESLTLYYEGEARADLFVQISPSRDNAAHFRDEALAFWQGSSKEEQSASAPLHLPRAALPPKPSAKAQLDKAETKVLEVMRSIQEGSTSRATAAGGEARSSKDPSTLTLKSFFQSNKNIISPVAMERVRKSEDRRKQVFGAAEVESRRRRRNAAHLPRVFDNIRGLFNSFRRRAMLERDVIAHLVSSAANREMSRADLVEQLGMMAKHASEWLFVDKDSSGNRIMQLRPLSAAALNSVRKKLSEVQQ